MAKAIELVSLRIDYMRRMWYFDLSPASRTLIFASVMMIPPRPVTPPWTISRPLLYRTPAKPIYSLLAGQEQPKRMSSGRLSYSRYPSYSPGS